MSKNINETPTGQITINNIEGNKNENEVQINPEEHAKNYILVSGLKNRIEEKKKNELSNVNKNPKIKIFKVIYRYTHNGQAKDNIIQSIITSFINFLVKFINDIIFKKLNKKDLFNIDHKIKSKIKLANILKLNVEEILTFKRGNIMNYKNKEKIQEIKKSDSSLIKLFKIHVITLFKDIYYNKKNIKQLDLKKYGIEGLNFEINEEIPTYEKLKESFKNNSMKLNILDEVIKEFVKYKKFKIRRLK